MKPELLAARTVSHRETAPGPVFVGGLARSGKTLARRALAAHTKVVFSRRTNLWTAFSGRYGDLSDPSNFERCVAAMMGRKQIAALQPDVDRLRQDFVAGPRTYARLFDLLHSQYSARHGRERWGDQTALVELFTDELMTAYPGARVIHMIRDPRDVHVAVQAKYGARATSLGVITASWKLSAGRAERYQRAYPDAYRVVRYETLAGAPEQTLRELCEFIGESYGPTTALPGSRSSQPLTDHFVGEYRDVIDPGDLAFIERFAGRMMASHGYLPAGVPGNRRERWQSAWSAWPVHRASYSAQRIRDAVAFHPGIRRRWWAR